MNKPYTQMTPAERIADRIAKNKEVDARAAAVVARRRAVDNVRTAVKVRRLSRKLDRSLRQTTGEGLPQPLLKELMRPWEFPSK